MTTLDTAPRTAAFRRTAMIVCAVVSPLTIAISLLIAPFPVTQEGEAYVRNLIAHLDAYTLAALLGALSVITLIPAIFAVSHVARSGRPVLGLVGMILAFCSALPVSTNTDDVIVAAARSGVAPNVTARLVDTLDNDLPTSPLGMLFLVGLVGYLLLGIAVLTGRTAPVWASAALIIAPVLIPIPWFTGLPNLVAAATWLLLTLGFAGVALSLPRLP
jgi:hypothetical protein